MKDFYKYLTLWALFAVGCEGDSEKITLNDSSDYFPLQIGFYQVYDVTEITYATGSDPDTAIYELKTEVLDSFMNTAGSITYVIYRSVRSNETEPWQFRETWSSRIENNEVVVMEGNIPYVKLTLPTEAGRQWDGNMFNNLGSDSYTVLRYDEPADFGQLSFDNTLTVEQEANDDPIVYTDLRTEIYARNAGLVYKETTQLVICQAQSCNSNEIIERGVKLKQTINAYGVK